MAGNFGKWIGGGLGWALGGPIGGLLGFVVGSLFDGVTDEVGPRRNPYEARPQVTMQGDFTASLLVLSAAVMKADGRTVKAELDVVKEFLKANFGVEKTKELLLTLREIMNKDIPVRQVCLQIRAHLDHPARLQLMHFLFGIAAADGKVDKSEEHLLHTIAEYLYINPADMSSLKAMFIKDTDSAYKILEITPEATDDEVKKAYRKIAAKYHPDKVASLGEEVVKAANEKFKQVNDAYDQIKKQRGIK